MTQTRLIASTDLGTGKTAIAVALGLLAKDEGLDVGYMKPKGTRLRSRVGKVLDDDPLLASELLGLDEDISQMEPVVYSSTFIDQVIRGREDPRDIRNQVVDCFEGLAESRDCMIIEGATSISMGSVIDLTDIDLARELDAEVIIVAGYESIRDLDDIVELANRFGERVHSVIFNGIRDATLDSLETSVVPFLEERGVVVEAIVPREQTMAAVTVDMLADELGAKPLTSIPSDLYIERFSVGAMGDEAAIRQFRRTEDAIVVTGGDRPGVQAAAIDAAGVKALLLTGGYRPSTRILGKAETNDVPVLLVQTDTGTTIDRVESIISEGRVRDETTVRRMRELLDDRTEIEAFFDISGSLAD